MFSSIFCHLHTFRSVKYFLHYIIERHWMVCTYRRSHSNVVRHYLFFACVTFKKSLRFSSLIFLQPTEIKKVFFYYDPTLNFFWGGPPSLIPKSGSAILLRAATKVFPAVFHPSPKTLYASVRYDKVKPKKKTFYLGRWIFHFLEHSFSE